MVYLIQNERINLVKIKKVVKTVHQTVLNYLPKGNTMISNNKEFINIEKEKIFEKSTKIKYKALIDKYNNKITTIESYEYRGPYCHKKSTYLIRKVLN